MPAQTVIRLRRGTATQWSSANPILSAGEIGIETNTRKFKFGNGTSAWNSLDYAVGSVAVEGITIAWDDVTGKPETFPPSAHTHVLADVTDVTATATELNYVDGVTSSIQTQIDGKAATSHTHTISQVTDYDRTAGTVLSDNPPVSPVAGLRWIKTATMQEYVYFDSFWVEI